MGTRKSNKKHKQVSITIHSIKTIMYSNIKNKEREIHNKAIGEIDFSNLKPLMYDPNNQNKEPYVTILLSKFQLDPTISETWITILLRRLCEYANKLSLFSKGYENKPLLTIQLQQLSIQSITYPMIPHINLCLDLEWKVWFLPRWITLWLSTNSESLLCTKPSSCKNFFNNENSLHAFVIAMNFAFCSRQCYTHLQALLPSQSPPKNLIKWTKVGWNQCLHQYLSRSKPLK